MADFAALTPEQIRAHRETVLLRLLTRVAQRETAQVVQRLQSMGHADVQISFIGVLGNVDTEGTRLVELARRVGTTRQAVGQSVREIERRGYLERVDDPTDRRGVIVRHTLQGRKLLNDALTVMAELEAGYETAIGVRRMRELTRALAMLADTIDPGSRFS